MRWIGCGALLLILATGCDVQPAVRDRTSEENRLFSPVSMQLDNFSKVRDWTGGGNPNGIEALVEFDDPFGDRTKAAGTILFELYDYRTGYPDPRGNRVVNPFSASLQTYDEQKAHWDRASGAYTFQLACDGLQWDKSYVLTATYESPGGDHRLFSQIVLPATDQTHGRATPPAGANNGQRFPQP
jgi:hypothetical protein